MIEAIIFDKDGTLFDFQATWGVWTGLVIEELSQGDAQLMAALADRVDYDPQTKKLRPSSFVIAGAAHEIVDAVHPMLQGWDWNDLAQFLNGKAALVPQVPVADLDAVLGQLRGDGYKLAVMTNDAESSARVHLAPYLDMLDMVVGSDSGHGAKPDPDPLLAIAKALGVAPAACAMVGDSTHDLGAGRAAGMQTIGVLTGPASRSDLTHLADVVLQTVADIPSWLGTDTT